MTTTLTTTRPDDWPELNLPPLDEVVQFLVDNPDRHRQLCYSSVGPATREYAAGLGIEYDDLVLSREWKHGHKIPCGTVGCLAGWVTMLNSDYTLGEIDIHASSFTRELCGLTNQEATVMFSVDNSLGMLVDGLAALHAGRNIVNPLIFEEFVGLDPEVAFACRDADGNRCDIACEGPEGCRHVMAWHG